MIMIMRRRIRTMMMMTSNNLGNALHRGMPGIRRFTNSCCTNFHNGPMMMRMRMIRNRITLEMVMAMILLIKRMKLSEIPNQTIFMINMHGPMRSLYSI